MYSMRHNLKCPGIQAFEVRDISYMQAYSEHGLTVTQLKHIRSGG